MLTYKKYFWGCLGIALLIVCEQFLLAWFIDPIGIFGRPAIKGFNHWKIEQYKYMDVFKPYEYLKEKPDILYIGASFILTGFRPIDNDYPYKKCYNFGLSGLTLPDMMEYVHFVCVTHKPEKIYLGLSPAFFCEYAMEEKRNGYSKERLQNIAQGSWHYWKQAIEDSLGLTNVNLPTIIESRLHKKNERLFLHGWLVQMFGADSLNPEKYYQSMFGNVRSYYANRQYSPKALECIRQIVTETNDAGVELVIFFAPTSIDAYAAVNILGYEEECNQIKRQVAEIIPVYDFYHVNELTTNREEYFYDTTHFRASLGEKLKASLESGNPEPYGYLLTPKTVIDVFAKEDAAWEKWRMENQEYVDILKEYIETKRTPKVGSFTKFIGF